MVVLFRFSGDNKQQYTTHIGFTWVLTMANMGLDQQMTNNGWDTTGL